MLRDIHSADETPLIYDAKKSVVSDLVEELLDGWLKKTK